VKTTLGRTLILLALVASMLPLWAAPPARAEMTAPATLASDIRISQVYGGGGNSGAVYTHDFIELFNAGAAPVSLAGWSVQYASATGSSWQVTELSGSIAPGGYYLIQEAQGSGGTTPLPTPDAIGSIAMSATAGKVALVNTTTALSGACPGGASIIDFVGYGSTANCYEGSGPTPAPSNTNAVLRADGGCVDTDNNSADFSASPANPRNSSSPAHPCGAVEPAFTIVKEAPAKVTVGAAFTYTLIAANQTGGLRASVVITDSLPLSLTVGTISDGGVLLAGNVVSWTIPSLADETSVTRTVQVTAPITPTTLVNSDYVIWASDWPTRATGSAATTQVRPAITPIYDIQYTTTPGGNNTYPSPYAGEVVTTTGTVCAVLNRGYTIADAAGPWHSVYTYVGSSGSKPPKGLLVQVSGSLIEYNGMTEFSYAGFTVLGNGDDVCQPTVVTAAQVPYNNAALSEPYEGVIVEYRNITITSISTYIATFVDGSGASGAFSVNSSYSYVPPGLAVGQRYDYVRGPLSAYYDQQYSVYIPSASDIRLTDLVPPTVESTTPPDAAADVNPHKPLSAAFSEALDPATVTTSSFTLDGPGGAVTGTVSYAAQIATFTPNAALQPFTPYTATLTTAIKDLAGNSLPSNYVWTFTTGPLDTVAPTIIARSPAPEAADVAIDANVVITFSEELNPTTLIPANLTLTGPYGNIQLSVSGNPVVTLNPSGLLLPTTRYTVTISAAVVDWAGNPLAPADRSWSFTTEVEPEMYAYHGDIHNHTSYSDGSSTPTAAFTSAQACGLDFLAITDHSYSIEDNEWEDTLAAAEAATVNGVFVGLRGFEYTQGAEGHINVYNSTRHAVRSDTTSSCTYCDYTPNLEQGVTVEGFYHWLAITGTMAVDAAGTVMQFNHPGWINFNDWAYHPEVEDVAELEEVGNGWGSSYVFSWEEWIRSLDYGWQVGATNNSDNHELGWGCITPHRTGVVMPALTKENLLAALRARRTFATEDANAALFFKGNGFWMGSEMPNSGQIAFHIWGNDPDGESGTLELVTSQGQVITSTTAAATFDWAFDLDIGPGVHYFFVLLTQEDGDRLVSSPIWTSGEEDIRISDLSVQPTIPTIYNPSLFTARVTNRGSSTQTVTATFTVNGAPIGAVPLTVPPCSNGPCNDGYANISWQPAVTGAVTVTVALVGAPAGDNPIDNSRSLEMTVTDERVPLVLIDAGHGNIGTSPRDARHFVNDMTLHGYNVLFNLDQITPSDLNTETVRLLVINAYGPVQLNPSELSAIANFVAAGGNVWLNGMSDYTGKVWWANTIADRMNGLLAAIESAVGSNIPVRMNDDEVLDGNNNNGYPWGILWHVYPVSQTTGVGMNVQRMQSWSVNSLVDRNRGALTQADLGENGWIMVIGDDDSGYGTYGNPNRTTNTDADGQGDAYIYSTVPGSPLVPAAAGYDIPGPAGRLFLYGDSNDPFNIFAYTAGDGKQNELFNLEVVMWLMGTPLQRMTIAEAREDPEQDDLPINLDRLVWVEGVVTSSYGEFFDVLTVQDETAGITVFAPAGTASAAVETIFKRGDCVRVVGTVDVYQGDTEIQFFETEQIQVLTPTCVISTAMSITGGMPLPLSTYEATLEENEGWLVVVTGTVSAISPAGNAIWVDDGSGPVRAFLDGYNGTWSDVQLLDRVVVAGLASEDGQGPRIRVRNHGMHADRPDDLIILSHNNTTTLTIAKAVEPAADIEPGDEVTYTVTLSNSGNTEAVSIALTDTLPAGVTFGGWVEQSNADYDAGAITWSGSLPPGGELTLVFTATVDMDEELRGQTITNTAEFSSLNGGAGQAQAAFTVRPLSHVYLPLVVRNRAATALRSWPSWLRHEP